jgi:hypothetical protein
MLIIRIHDGGRTPQNNQRGKLGQLVEKAFRYPRADVSQSETVCRIVFPAGHIVERDNGYSISVEEKGLLIDLELERCLPPVSIGDEVLYYSENRQEFFSWYVPLPKASTRGRIKFDDEHIEADGIAYHDHNWGNINVGKCLGG